MTEQLPANPIDSIRDEVEQIKLGNSLLTPDRQDPNLQDLDPGIVGEREADLWQKVEKINDSQGLEEATQSLAAYREELKQKFDAEKAKDPSFQLLHNPYNAFQAVISKRINGKMKDLPDNGLRRPSK